MITASKSANVPTPLAFRSDVGDTWNVWGSQFMQWCPHQDRAADGLRLRCGGGADPPPQRASDPRRVQVCRIARFEDGPDHGVWSAVGLNTDFLATRMRLRGQVSEPEGLTAD